MKGLSETRRRALLAAAVDPDGLLPAGVNQRTAIGLEELGYIERWPLFPGDQLMIGDCAAWPFDVHLTPVGRAEAERLGAAPTPARVLVIPCGAAKRRGFQPFPAGELYIGGYHRACRAAADRLAAGAGSRVLILSAKFGLVSTQRPLWPYEMTLRDPGAVTPEFVRRQARAMGVTAAAAVVLAGQAYTDLARTVWPNAETPLAGVGGMGKQKQLLARIAAAA